MWWRELRNVQLRERGEGKRKVVEGEMRLANLLGCERLLECGNLGLEKWGWLCIMEEVYIKEREMMTHGYPG